MSGMLPVGVWFIWFGDVKRMNGENWVKRIMDLVVLGGKKVRRPRRT